MPGVSARRPFRATSLPGLILAMSVLAVGTPAIARSASTQSTRCTYKVIVRKDGGGLKCTWRFWHAVQIVILG